MELKGVKYERSQLENSPTCTEDNKRQRSHLHNDEFGCDANGDEGLEWFRTETLVVSEQEPRSL